MGGMDMPKYYHVQGGMAMTNREYVKTQIEMLPESIIEKVMDFISFQRYTSGLFDNDTDYLMSVSGMTDKIKDGLKTPLSECVPLSGVWEDV